MILYTILKFAIPIMVKMFKLKIFPINVVIFKFQLPCLNILLYRTCLCHFHLYVLLQYYCARRTASRTTCLWPQYLSSQLWLRISLFQIDYYPFSFGVWCFEHTLIVQWNGKCESSSLRYQ